jgi:hypothetical protein
MSPKNCASLALLTLLGCNQHVFTVIDPVCHAERVELTPVQLGKPVDILLVVDNSASMCEEQASLAENFLDPDCPIDINNPDPAFINPTPQQVDELRADCGFIQILSLFEATDFRLGVITTDVSECDNAFLQAQSDQFAPLFGCFEDFPFPDRGKVPQVGCLQAPSTLERKFLAAGDEDLDVKFTSILDRVQTWGSSAERGFDATARFLAGETPHAACATDADDFLRDDARLAVVYLTDEDDCSHGDDFPDDTAGITCEEVQQVPSTNASDCYDRADELTPPQDFVDLIHAFKPAGDTKVAVIGGFGDDGAASCSQGAGDIDRACTPTFGGSNDPRNCSELDEDGDGEPDGVAVRATGLPCCEADAATRYEALADGFGGAGLRASICVDFRDTLIEIAEFIGRVEDVVLTQPPPEGAEIVVSVSRRGGGAELLPRIPDDATDPEAEDGFQYDGGTTLNFFGRSAPQPGDVVEVHYSTLPPGEDCADR